MVKYILYLLFFQLFTVTSYAQCSELTRQADKQGDRVVITTSGAGKRFTEPVQYRRVQEHGNTSFFVQLRTKGGSFVPQTGASILFKDGSHLEWAQATIKSTFAMRGAGYASQCLIQLTESDIEQFQQKEIIAIKLHTYDRNLTPQQAQRAKDIINCVLGADLIDIKSDKLVSQ